MANIELDVNVNVNANKAPKKESPADELKKETTELKHSTEQIDKKVKADKREAKANKEVSESLITTISTLKMFSETLKHVFNKIENLVEKQSDYAENLNLMQNAFKETNDVALDYIDTLGDLYGFDESSLTKSLGLFRQLADAMGIASETADKLSYNLEGMALDISSLYNVSVERSANALQSALTGNIKSIRALTGADITQATLQQKALALGIDESVRSMSRAEKAMLIYLTLADQLSNAQGDMTRTINGTANQLKIFKDQCAELARNIGGLLLPIFRNLLYYLNGILMAVNEVIGSILSLFGIQAVDLAEEFGIATSDLSDIFDEIGDSATTATNKIQRSLRSFDKLNNLSSQKGSSGGGISAGDVGVMKKLQELMTTYDNHLGEVENKARKIRDHILDWLGFSQDVNGEWEWSATNLLKNIWNWWRDLNIVGKEFVSIGVVLAVKKLLTSLKSLGSFLANSKIGVELYTIVGSIGEKGLTGTIEALFKQHGKLATFMTTLAGFTVIADGVVRFVDGIKKMVDGTAEITDYIRVVSSLLEVLSGLLIVIGSLTGQFQLVTAGIIGLGTAISLNLIADVEDATNVTKQYANELDRLHTAEEELIKTSESRGTKAKLLYENLTKLYDSEGNLIGSYDTAKSTLALLNKELDTEYTLTKDGTIEYNKKKVAVKELGKEVDEYCEKLKKQAYQQAFEKSYNALIERQIELEVERNKKIDELRKSQEKYDMTTEEGTQKWYKANEKKIKNLNDLDGVIKANRDNYSKYMEAITLSEEGKFDEATKLVSNLANSEKVALSETVKAVITGSDEMVNSIMKNLTGLANVQASINIKGHLDTTQAEKELKQWEKKVQYTQSQLEKKGLKLTTGGYSLSGVPQKADGGFLDQGQLFIANEKGAEMIGTIGHKTAVANNDQIVESISIGVAKANMATQSKQPVVIEAKGDASGLLDFITFKQKEKDRQYGM